MIFSFAFLMNCIFGADCHALTALHTLTLNDEGFFALVNYSVMRTGFKAFAAGDAAILINLVSI